NVSEDLGRLRIGRACMLLVETAWPIGMVAAETGFSNLSNGVEEFEARKRAVLLRPAPIYIAQREPLKLRISSLRYESVHWLQGRLVHEFRHWGNEQSSRAHHPRHL